MKSARKTGKASAGTARSPGKSAASKKKAPGRAPARAAAKTAVPAAPAKKPRGAPPAGGSRASRRAQVLDIDPGLFEPLSEGERADALRVMTEDRRLGNMAKVARYRVVAAEPLVLKPPHPLVGHRLARVVAFDYASDRSIDALVDLDTGQVAHLQQSQAQPALAREEETLAVQVALRDDRVKRELGLGDHPQAALHYWSRRDADLAFGRRSAAVLFGQPGQRPTLVAVVDLVDGQVADIVPAEQW